jgi:uncharacterized protein YndB with AHSA1/START domain
MIDAEVLEVSIHVEATRETVFPYFTDPVRYAQWMGTDVVLDAVPGGTYRVRMREGLEASGTFVEVDAPNRLVFTWGWVGEPSLPPGSSRVEVTLNQEHGGTRVVLRHHGLPSADQRDHHRSGWDMYLARLGEVIAGGEPGRDPNT